jgi:hypothetical protein
MDINLVPPILRTLLTALPTTLRVEVKVSTGIVLLGLAAWLAWLR